VPIATAYVPRPPDACFRVFTDPNVLAAWLPGLRSTRVIATNADGTPLEIQFEFAESRMYTLVYEYDHAAREVRWEPRLGKRDAVRGSAKFDPFDEGTRVTYTFEHTGGAQPAPGSSQELLDAFTRWMQRR
jgi:uncharacterized protein YndB with AHSA1/START domain